MTRQMEYYGEDACQSTFEYYDVDTMMIMIT